MTRDDALDRHSIGVDRIMWGSDFPHDEGTFPHTREALAHAFAGIDRSEVAAMVGGNAAQVYGFDLTCCSRSRTGSGPIPTPSSLESTPSRTQPAWRSKGVEPAPPD